MSEVRDRPNLCAVLLSGFLARQMSFLLVLSCLFFFLSSPLDLRLSVTSKSPVNHARYVPRNVALPPGEFSLTTPHSGEGVPLCVRTVRLLLPFFGPMSTMLKGVLLIIRQPCHRTGDPVRIILTTLPLPTAQSMGSPKLTGDRPFFPIASSLPLRNTCTVGLPA